jgi:hypothetical protein
MQKHRSPSFKLTTNTWLPILLMLTKRLERLKICNKSTMKLAKLISKDVMTSRPYKVITTS